MERIAEALRTVWESSIPAQPSSDVPDPVRAELQPSLRPESILDFGPFSDRQKNAVWAAASVSDAPTLRDDWESLADLD
eukprot:2580060-Rhodomonas_salina.1